MAVRRSRIPISVELTESAVHLWEFLKLIDNYPWLYEGLHVHNAVRRYEVYWLPLVAKIDPRYPMAAPLDIEWVWYVHMLSPYAYNRDCLHRFGQVVNHRITTAKDRNIGLNNAREIWEKAFPKEEFSLDLTAPPKITDTFTSKFSYDLFAAIFRQRFFNYQVALNHYRDLKFLEKATKRYKDYLRGRLEDPGLMLSGCFDIQLIWHAHLMHPILYREDTRQLFGEMLGHYDTETAESGVVSRNDPPVREKSLPPKAIPGAMYRGENIICTREQILLTQDLDQLTMRIKLLREDFLSTVLIATTLRSRDLMLNPCWFNLPSLSLSCVSTVMNISQGKNIKKYDVRVVHSLAPILSAVEIMHPKGYLVATAHTIAGKQIPMKSQLGELGPNTCAYTPEARERAMLIRSQKDWGICVGRWMGNSESGHLAISFYNMQTNKWQTVNQSNSANAEFGIFEISIFDETKSVFINLGTGDVTVPYTDIATFLPEIMALAYSIGVLYVLCRERTREFYPVEPFLSNDMKSLQPCPFSKEIRASRATKRDGIFSSKSGGKKSMWLNRDPYVSSVLLATGRNCPWAPSNSFLKFYHEKVPAVFESCVSGSNDDRAPLDAKLEVEELVEYLGVTGGRKSGRGTHRDETDGRRANQGSRATADKEESQETRNGKSGGKKGDHGTRKKKSRKDKEGHKGRHKDDLTNGGSGLMAARDRFSNMQISGRADDFEDEYYREPQDPNDNESVFV
ncbi:uncharacterized protein LOC114522569 isoform X2 [Dendronephthya gigantea]|nr:uncharacterized protein LOC114522569 isoform X2 [Dendronephthya gigantea]